MNPTLATDLYNVHLLPVPMNGSQPRVIYSQRNLGIIEGIFVYRNCGAAISI